MSASAEEAAVAAETKKVEEAKKKAEEEEARVTALKEATAEEAKAEEAKAKEREEAREAKEKEAQGRSKRHLLNRMASRHGLAAEMPDPSSTRIPAEQVLYVCIRPRSAAARCCCSRSPIDCPYFPYCPYCPYCPSILPIPYCPSYLLPISYCPSYLLPISYCPYCPSHIAHLPVTSQAKAKAEVGEWLVRAMHHCGVNCRYMGIVWAPTNSKAWRKVRNCVLRIAYELAYCI
jgi:hypothetical protein